MSLRILAQLLVVLALILSGCGQQPAATQAPIVEAAPSNTPLPSDTPTATVDAAATQSAQQTADVQATAHARSTKVVEQKTQVAESKDATATEQAYVTLTATAAVQATADARAAAFQTVVDQLYADGVIQSNEGEYIPLEDFEGSQAQIDTPFVFFLDMAAVDFIISADMVWESASDNANWPTSGCGFVYGYKDRYNADLTFLGLDGYTHSMQFRDDRPAGLFAFKKWGDPDRPKGAAKAMLVVSNQRVSVYVDDVLANAFHNGLYKGGDIGLNIFSGTNKGYGTRCTFSDIQLYIPAID